MRCRLALLIATVLAFTCSAAQKQSNGNCKLTSLSRIKHSSWVQAFRYTSDDKEKGCITEYSGNNCDKESDVWEWLFRQHR